MELLPRNGHDNELFSIGTEFILSSVLYKQESWELDCMNTKEVSHKSPFELIGLTKTVLSQEEELRNKLPSSVRVKTRELYIDGVCQDLGTYLEREFDINEYELVRVRNIPYCLVQSLNSKEDIMYAGLYTSYIGLCNLGLTFPFVEIVAKGMLKEDLLTLLEHKVLEF